MKDLHRHAAQRAHRQRHLHIAFSADGKARCSDVRDDAAKRFYWLYRHTLGSSAAEKRRAGVQEPDERFVRLISRTRT